MQSGKTIPNEDCNVTLKHIACVLLSLYWFDHSQRDWFCWFWKAQSPDYCQQCVTESHQNNNGAFLRWLPTLLCDWTDGYLLITDLYAYSFNNKSQRMNIALHPDVTAPSHTVKKNARYLLEKRRKSRRCRQLPSSITSTVANSFLQGARAGWEVLWWRAKTGTKKRRLWKGEMVTAPLMHYTKTCPLEKVIYCRWPPKNAGEAVTNYNTEQMAAFLRGPNLSSPIKAIGPQQSGLIAQ